MSVIQAVRTLTVFARGAANVAPKAPPAWLQTVFGEIKSVSASSASWAWNTVKENPGATLTAVAGSGGAVALVKRKFRNISGGTHPLSAEYREQRETGEQALADWLVKKRAANELTGLSKNSSQFIDTLIQRKSSQSQMAAYAFYKLCSAVDTNQNTLIGISSDQFSSFLKQLGIDTQVAIRISTTLKGSRKLEYFKKASRSTIKAKFAKDSNFLRELAKKRNKADANKQPNFSFYWALGTSMTAVKGRNYQFNRSDWPKQLDAELCAYFRSLVINRRFLIEEEGSGKKKRPGSEIGITNDEYRVLVEGMEELDRHFNYS